MKSKALKKANNEADSVWACKFEVWWRRQFAVNFNDLLKENGDGAHTVPKEHWEVIVSFSFSAEKVESLLSFFRDSQILDVLYDWR